MKPPRPKDELDKLIIEKINCKRCKGHFYLPINDMCVLNYKQQGLSFYCPYCNHSIGRLVGESLL